MTSKATQKLIGRMSLALALISVCLLGALPAAAEESQRVMVQLRWLHQFQFAGYYAALENGYYREAGLDVTLVEGGPGRDPIEEVLSGRAQYGAASNEVLLARLRAKPVKVLAVIFQQSPSILLARKASGINSPQDMLGQRVMMMPGMGDAELLAMFMKEGVKLENIHRLPTSFNIDDLITGKTDAINAYLTNEPYYMEQKGMPAVIIRPATYGINFYGDCLFTSEREIADNPERVKTFCQATLRGWQYAMDHPEEVIELILSKYSAKKTRDHLRYEAAAMRELLQPEMIQMGHMNPGRWRHMAETFADLGLVGRDFKLDGLTYDPEAEKDLTPFLWAGGVALGVLLVVGSLAVFLARFNMRLRKEVDERARAEERLRAMAANVPGVIFQMELFADGRREYRYLSPQANEFFGADPQTIIAEKRLLPWHPDDRERIQREVAAVGDGARGINLVGRILRQDGQVKWVQLTASVPERSGGQRLTTGFILDITQRKLAEMEYLASERKIKAMSQAVDDALVMLDSQGKVRFWNPAAERLFGYLAQEAMGMDFHAMAAPPHLREKAREGLQRFAQTGGGPVLGTTTEIEAQDRQGRVFPVEVTLSAFQMDQEWFAVGTVRDISARKLAEEALKDKEQRLAAIIDFLPDPALVIDKEGRVVSWNRSMERLTGVKKEDMIGKRDHEYALPFYGERRPILVDLVSQWSEEVAQKYLHIRKEGDCLISESYHPDLGDGGLYLSGTATALYDAGGRAAGAIETLRDITERKRAEALMVEKEVAEEAAARAEQARHEAEEAQRELQAKLQEIERFNRLALGREQRIIELKRQVNTMATQAGFEKPFDEQAVEPANQTAPEAQDQPAPEQGLLEIDSDQLADMLASSQFSDLMDSFWKSVGIPAAIIDLDARVLASSPWQRACTDFHRTNPITCARCIESDTQLALQLNEGQPFSMYRCKNGLTDCASPVVIGGRHVANAFVGQFFTAPPDMEFFRRQARECGLDVEAYLAAIAEVPVVSEDRLPAILSFLLSMAHTVVSMSVESLRAQRAELAMARRTEEIARESAAALSLAEDAELARREIENYKGRLELLVEERTEELKASEERSRLLLESAGEGIFGVDAQGRLTFINPSALAMLGFSEADLLGQGVHQLIHHTRPDGSAYPEEECPMHASFNKGTAHHVHDEVLWRSDGTTFPVEYFSTPITKNGRVLGAVITFRDITERQAAQQALAKERALFLDILEKSPISIAITSQGIIRFVNPIVHEKFGFKVGDAAPKVYVREADREALLEILQREGIVKNREVQMWSIDKHKLDMLVTFVPISFEDEPGVLAWLIDITERKRAEEEMRQYVEDLERFNRLTLGREERMIELKEEINGLLEKAGVGRKYKIADESELHQQ